MMLGRFIQKNQLQYDKNQAEIISKLTPSSDLITLSSFNWPVLYGMPLYAHSFLFSDQQHVKKGEVSWMYHRIKLFFAIFPYADHLYLHGALYTGIIHNDVESGRELFSLGIKKYPDQCLLLYHSMMFEFSEKNFLKGKSFFDKIDNKCPEYKRLVIFLRETYTKKNGVKNILHFYQHSLPDNPLKTKIEDKIDNI